MKNSFVLVILLIALGVIPLLDLFHGGLPITHDGQDHVARIANFYQNLAEGNIIPRWAPNLNWGYGHPILMFLYPLPSYFASLFRFLGFSFVDSTKLVFVVAYVASGLAMYLWAKSFLGKSAGFAAALLYLFAPYRFVDMYVRGAIGEHVAFIFPPLLCYFLIKLSQKPSPWIFAGASFSLGLLILSHNAISLMFVPLILLYGVYLAATIRKKVSFLKMFASVLLLGFGMTAFFWVPAFFEGKYTLRDIVTKNGSYASSFSTLQSFFYGQWNYGGTGQFTVQIGIVHWIIIISSIVFLFLLYKKKDVLWKPTAGALSIFFLILWLMTENSYYVWQNISILQKFQFPWRLLSVEVFLVAFLGGVCFSFLSNRYKLIGIIAFTSALLFVSRNYWHAKGYLHKPESFYSGIYSGTTDTGESAPIWSVRFMEKRPKAHLEVIEGNASIQEAMRFSINHKYTVNVAQRTRFRKNTLYFPGWSVLANGKKVAIEFQDPANRGIMTFFLEKGYYSIDIKFTETRLRKIANAISLISFCTLILAILIGNTYGNTLRRFGNV